ncbi:MAG: major capsid protein, partial [Rhodoplanes sp.]
MREGVVFSTLKHGGITFENYRGWIGGGADAGDTMRPCIDPNEAHCFPPGTPNQFKTFFAPADHIETVSTLGLSCYAKAIPFDNNKSVRLKMQT